MHFIAPPPAARVPSCLSRNNCVCMQLISVLFCSALLCMRALIFAGPAGRRSLLKRGIIYYSFCRTGGRSSYTVIRSQPYSYSARKILDHQALALCTVVSLLRHSRIDHSYTCIASAFLPLAHPQCKKKKAFRPVSAASCSRSSALPSAVRVCTPAIPAVYSLISSLARSLSLAIAAS